MKYKLKRKIKNMNDEIRKNCLNCKNKPCSNNGCPLNNDIPGFIHAKNSKEAFEILCKTTVLPAICGIVCPHSKQCEGSCIRKIQGEAVSIGEMEALIGEEALKNNYEIPIEIDKNLKNKKVAIIGSGPAGLTCSAFLAKKGAQVTIYEKNSKLGGILSYGIPEFRLDTLILEKSIQKILDIGNITVKLNKKLGKDIFLKDLSKEYDAVFLGIGANISAKMNIEGENLLGVYGANEVLENKTKIEFKGKNIVVVGGGNVAIDMARTAKREGANEVSIIYRREEKQMPAENKEIEAAKSEGIKLLFNTNILKILGEKRVEQIECIKTELVEKEGHKRLYPVNIKNSNFKIDIDMVFMAVGSVADKELINSLELEVNEQTKIKIDEKGKTSIKNVYAGGDAVGNKQTIAWAARSGRNAAETIIDYLNKVK